MTESWLDGDGDLSTRIRAGSTAEPADWPEKAVETGLVASTDEYYDRLREATIEAAREAVADRERADDQQLVHAVRAMDDRRRKLV